MKYFNFYPQTKGLIIFLVVSVCSLACLPAFAQDPITFSSFKKGEEHKFTSTRIKKDFSNDTLLTVTTFTSGVTLTALQVTPEEQTLRWTYTSSTIKRDVITKESNPSEVANTLEYLTLKLFAFNTLNVIYTTNAAGAFKSVKNLEELRAHIRRVLDAAAAEKSKDKKFIGVLNQFRPVLLSEDYVAYTFIQDIQLYHVLNSIEPATGEKSYEIELPNPITGDALPGTLTLTGKQISDETYEVSMNQHIDEQKMSGVVKDKLNETYAAIGDKEKDTPPVRYQIDAKHTFKKGRVTSARQLKTVTSYESTSTEEISIQ